MLKETKIFHIKGGLELLLKTLNGGMIRTSNYHIIDINKKNNTNIYVVNE